MQTHSTYSQLAVARADAADRQRRADAYRQLRDVEEAGRFDRRRTSITVLVATAVGFGILATSPTAAAPELPEPVTAGTSVHERLEVNGWGDDAGPPSRLDHGPGTDGVPPGVR